MRNVSGEVEGPEEAGNAEGREDGGDVGGGEKAVGRVQRGARVYVGSRRTEAADKDRENDREHTLSCSGWSRCSRGEPSRNESRRPLRHSPPWTVLCDRPRSSARRRVTTLGLRRSRRTVGWLPPRSVEMRSFHPCSGRRARRASRDVTPACRGSVARLSLRPERPCTRDSTASTHARERSLVLPPFVLADARGFLRITRPEDTR